MKSLLKQMQACRGDLSKGQQRIAAYITDHYEQAAFMTAAKLGEAVGKSESTVVRFAHALGLSGYPELQEKMQEMVLGKLTSVQRAQLASSIPKAEVFKRVLTTDMNSIRTTLEMVDEGEFERAVTALLEARRVYVLGLRSSLPLAQFFANYMEYISGNVVNLPARQEELQETMLRMGKGDVLFVISFPRYSTRTAEATRFAKEKGTFIISLTDKMDSPIGLMGDVVLLAKSDMASFADSLTAPLSVINALIAAAGVTAGKQVEEHLEELEDVWGRDRVYLTDQNEGL